MLEWIGSIGDAFAVIMQMITTFFHGIISLFRLVADSFIFLGYSWTYLPSVLLVFCVAGIGVVIVFQLIGR